MLAHGDDGWVWCAVVHGSPEAGSGWHALDRMRALRVVPTETVAIEPDIVCEPLAGVERRVRVTVTAADGTVATAVVEGFGLVNTARTFAERAVTEARRLRSAT